jgi:hypothetical protein
LIAMLLPYVLAAQYRSTSVDESGQIHIVLDNGKELLPRKVPDQTSFGDPAVSQDHRTVGWLVMFPDPTATYKGAELPGGLVIFRAGHVLHTFTTDQTFWDWQFQDGGRLVAYCAGPTHGGAALCLRRDVNSGRVVTRWLPKEGTEPPAWVKGMHY